MGNSSKRCPVLIDDLIQSYEGSVGEDLEKKQKIIEALDENIRAKFAVENLNISLQQDVDKLLQAVKDWDVIAQPIQLLKRSRGERHPTSVEITQRVRNLAIDLINKYCAPSPELHAIDKTLKIVEISLRIVLELKEIFAEVPEIIERLSEDLIELEAQKTFILGVAKVKEINRQVEKLKEAAANYLLDDSLQRLVNQLLATVNTWDPSKQPFEANEVVAYCLRGLALHLWNECQELKCAIEITIAIKTKFQDVNGMNEVNKRIIEDLVTLQSIQSTQTIRSTQTIQSNRKKQVPVVY